MRRTGCCAPSRPLSLCIKLPDGRFKLTPMGDRLRSDAPNSVRGVALATGHPEMWAQRGELAYSVETGKPVAPISVIEAVPS
jgi:hypothetical protein